MSEATPESLKPDAEEKITELTEKLSAADRLIARKNQELQAMKRVLATTNQKVSDRDEEIEQLESKIQNLESELSSRSPTQSENSVPPRKLPTYGDLLKQLRAKPKKEQPKTDSDYVKAFLEMIEE